MAVNCLICGKIYNHQSALNEHLKKKHEVEKNLVSYSFHTYKAKCLDCQCSYRYISDLQYHLETFHKFKSDIEHLEFPNKDEFQKWIDTIQSERCINYVKKGQDPKRTNIYYNCNRSAVNTKYRSSHKRVTNSQGSCKVNFLCTSQIIAKDNNSTIKVTWYKSHYKHNEDVEHVRIPIKEKHKIANKLVSGISMSRIVDQTRDNIVEDQLKRVHLLTRKDVTNIKNSFGIHNVKDDGRRNKSDPVSVNMWVEEQIKLESENPVLFYKQQGHECDILEVEDFCIILMNKSQECLLKKFGNDVICIDSTHGLNKYDFECTTLMVLDEYREGFPCATMFTNRQDTGVFKLFFSKIQERVGNILTKTFMSDITLVFFNAWCEVMGPPEFQLYCAWHIDRAWQKNLNKIKDVVKREQVYKMVKYLQSFENENIFEEELNKAILYFLSDLETQVFGNYFVNNYSRNFKQWAWCYRKKCNINTNMHLEAAHKTIKYSYLDGIKVQRLDKGLNAIIKYVRDKTVLRIIKNKKGKTILKKKRKREEPLPITDDTTEIKIHMETLRRNNSDEDIERIKNECSKIIDRISAKSQKIDDGNILSQCRQQLNKIDLLLNIDDDSHQLEYVSKVNTDVKIAPNKKIEKQSYFSTIKRKPKKYNKKPTEEETSVIQGILNNGLFISQDPSHDHNYF